MDNIVEQAAFNAAHPQDLNLRTFGTEAAKSAYLAALARCPSTTGSSTDLAHTALEGSLDSALTRVLAKIQDRPDIKAVVDGYGPCMRADGFTATDWDGTISDVYATVAALPRNVDVATDPAWRDALAFEKRISTADSNCRRDLNARALAAALASLQQFQDDHADDLSRAARQWTDLAAG